MKLFDLVKRTDFTKSYFIIDEKKVENNIVYLKSEIVIDFTDEKPMTSNTEFSYYDLGKLLRINTKTAETVAYHLDKTKKFEFDHLEHFEDTCYIHLNWK